MRVYNEITFVWDPLTGLFRPICENSEKPDPISIHVYGHPFTHKYFFIYHCRHAYQLDRKINVYLSDR